MNNVIKKKKPKPQKERAWELDFIRAICILSVVWDHFMYDVGFLFRDSIFESGKQGFINLSDFAFKYFNSDFRAYGWGLVVFLFFFISGICTTFSRSNPLRTLKLGIAAALLSLVTHLIDLYFANGAFSVYIKFGVIHCFAACLLLYSIIEFFINLANPMSKIKRQATGYVSREFKELSKKSVEYKEAVKNKISSLTSENAYKKKELIFTIAKAVVFLAVTIAAFVINNKYNISFFDISFANKNVPATSQWTGLFVYTKDWRTADYFPLLPFFAFFMLGTLAGIIFYPRKKSLLPKLDGKWHLPISIIGRYTIFIYFLSQVLCFGLLYIFFPLF